MRDLTPETILQRVPSLTLQLGSDNTLLISLGGRPFQFGPHGLAILDAFHRPRPLRDVLAEFSVKVSGGPEWMDFTSTLVRLHDAGVLRDPAQVKPVLGLDPSAYDALPVQAAMLQDRRRTEAFLTAIREVVRPGDVVVDIGTGTGVLAIAAARAGARRVYAVEAGGIAEIARAMFAANGVADRVTVLRGWSTQMTLPERADVLTTEIIGHDPLEEQVLPVVLDARERLLRPGARQVPEAMTLWGLPLDLPPDRLQRYGVLPQALEEWRSWYEIDFAPLAAARGTHPLFVHPRIAQGGETLSDPVPIVRIDFRTERRLMIEEEAIGHAAREGTANAFLLYFDLQVSPEAVLSTSPQRADEHVSWRMPLWILVPPLVLRPGQPFRVRYRFDQNRSVITVEPG